MNPIKPFNYRSRIKQQFTSFWRKVRMNFIVFQRFFVIEEFISCCMRFEFNYDVLVFFTIDYFDFSYSVGFIKIPQVYQGYRISFLARSHTFFSTSSLLSFSGKKTPFTTTFDRRIYWLSLSTSAR